MMKMAATIIHGSSTLVSPFSRALDEEPAHAGDREDLLGDEQPTEERADVDRHHGDEGMSALRNPCLTITLRRGTPLARAVRM